MKMIATPKYPKILALGHRRLKNLLDDPVEITEKIDGSQFRFGVINRQLIIASKGAILDLKNPQKMFAPAVETVKQLKLPNDIFFFGETLHRPKHNALTYNAVPKGHIALFGAVHVSEQVWLPHEDVSGWANDFKIDVVPLISAGRLVHDELIENLHKFLQLESYLGGPNIEGIVIKNLHQDMMIGEQYVPFLTGKYVSEAFKEVHSNKKYGTAERKSKLEQLYESYRNEARWNKAVQHLKEKGTFAAELPTIGKIISEVKLDILEERSDEIKEDLFSIFKADLLRYSVRGLPEWFKEKLAKGDFDDK